MKMEIAGIQVSSLKNHYQTPLYVYDEGYIRNQCRLFKDGFSHPQLDTQVIYASKAFLSVYMAKLIQEEGLFIDCVSQGEIYTALKANFNPKHIVFHGNNKTEDDLLFALNNGIGTIVVDNKTEAKLLTKLVNKNHEINVFLRVNPGIDAHTHEYIKTSLHDSKFGMSIDDPMTLDVISLLSNQPNIHFKGTHSHIGSQILEMDAFLLHVDVMMNFYNKVKQTLSIDLSEINLGGGFGIKYLESDQVLPITKVLKYMLTAIDEKKRLYHLRLNKVYIEPGRSIVGEAGYTVYTINQIKTTLNQKNYLFIDGSMNDHIRTALYQAKYEAVISGKEHLPKTTRYTVAGKACESGDIIIHDILLPDAKENDLLVVKSTGAYHYSMASNYNRITIPAVVFINNGKPKLVVRRQSLDDLTSHDVMDL